MTDRFARRVFHSRRCFASQALLQLLLGVAISAIALPVSVQTLQADEPAVTSSTSTDHVADERRSARETAVALNYCRASFHRIQKSPNKRVLWEEREKILNNLNLNGIADQDVIRLYTTVLGEISDVQIAEREQVVIRQAHRKAFLKSLSVSAFSLGPQLATQNYLAAVQTGARSWWDYRDTVVSQELDEWRLEKTRLNAVVEQSSLFLDTFWKLARKRDIPDEWLIRGHDLDELAEAVRETDAEVRLRVLARMERFMDCFPPYHYYVARTHQELGHWTAARTSYQRVATLSGESFRRDEMLAAAYVNQALIEDYLKLASAPDTAKMALRESTDAWEVNLAAGLVLLRHARHRDAEEAILRNLDVDLEQSQSRIALMNVYRIAGEQRKLAALLNRSEDLDSMPTSQLLLGASSLQGEQLPRTVTRTLTESLAARFDRHFGREDLVINGGSAWQFDRVRMAIRLGDKLLTRPRVTVTRDGYEVRFSNVPANAATNNSPLALILQYPDVDSVVVYLQELSPQAIASALGTERSPLARLPIFGDRASYRLTAVDRVGERTLLPTGLAENFRSIPIAGTPRLSKSRSIEATPRYLRVGKPIAPTPISVMPTAPTSIADAPEADDLPVVSPY